MARNEARSGGRTVPDLGRDARGLRTRGSGDPDAGSGQATFDLGRSQVGGYPVPVPVQVLVPSSSGVGRQFQSVSGRSAVAGASNQVERGTYRCGECRLLVSEQVLKVTTQGRSGHAEDVVASDNAVVGEPVDRPDRYLGRQPSDGSGDGRNGHPGQVRADCLPGQDQDWTRLVLLSQVDRAYQARSPKDVCAAKAARSSRSSPSAAALARMAASRSAISRRRCWSRAAATTAALLVASPCSTCWSMNSTRASGRRTVSCLPIPTWYCVGTGALAREQDRGRRTRRCR